MCRPIRVIRSGWALLLAGAIVLASGCATADLAGAPSAEGVSLYRAKNYEAAWSALKPLADKGHYRAQRYVAFMLMQGNAPFDCAALEDGPDDCGRRATALMMDAARRGDNNALIVLEGMRAGGAPQAPSDADMVALETARSERGDPMTAWRLATRYRTGDGVEPSANEAVKWLRVAAKGTPRLYPKAADAAFLLCEAYARGDGVEKNLKRAQQWCRQAARDGHSGAVIALARLENSDVGGGAR
ncbi:MAG: hypothetical protein AAFY22_06000 [Pseudomonadota bacterium]